jgi:hypothetical protein
MEQAYTLLYTDLVGSTEVNTRLGDGGMAPLWERHDRGFRDLLRLWRGREIDRSDGFAVLFEQPADAAAFAVAYHRMLAALPVPLRARAGLHVGPLTLRQNLETDIALGAKPFEVVGIARAVSARLMALAAAARPWPAPAPPRCWRKPVAGAARRTATGACAVSTNRRRCSRSATTARRSNRRPIRRRPTASCSATASGSACRTCRAACRPSATPSSAAAAT